MRNRRCVTLIELLIAVVLLLALGVLVLPALMNTIDERAFESSADVTNEQLMMARAHAQATGSPVEVTYNAQSSQVQARIFASSDSNSSSLSAKNLPAFDATDDGSPRLADNVIGESWACRSLSHGVRILAKPPTAMSTDHRASDTAMIAAEDEPQTIADLGKGQDVRLAVFMPDGSALLGDPVWINDDKGRCGMLSINPWSGLPLFQRLADQSEEPFVDDDEFDASRPTGKGQSTGSDTQRDGKERGQKDRSKFGSGSSASTFEGEDDGG